MASWAPWPLVFKTGGFVVGFKILLPLDGTAVSLQQARFAIQLSLNGLKAEYVVTNIQEPASFYEVLRVHDPQALARLTSDTAQELMQPALELLDAAKLPYETIILEDNNPVQGMLDLMALHDCDLAIVGLHDRSLFERRGLYATSERLARAAPIPVLSVRAPVPQDAEEA